MPNEKNLIPFNKRTEEEQREIRASGGRASGVTRRRNRALKEAADLYLSLPVSDRRKWNALAKRGIDPEDIDNQMAMIVGLADAAAEGDARAGRLIVDLLGDGAGSAASESREDDPITKSLKEEAAHGTEPKAT